MRFIPIILSILTCCSVCSQNLIDTTKIEIIDFSNDGSYNSTIFHAEILESNYTGVKYISHEMPYYMFNEVDYGENQLLPKSSNVKIIFKIEYTAGTKTKVTGFYENNAKWYEMHFNRNGRHNISRQWYPNGNKKSINEWRNGKLLDIPDTSWYSNGLVHSTSVINEGNKIYKSWYMSGVLANETVKQLNESTESFYGKDYYKTGELSMEANYNNGVQSITFYYKNGTIGRKGNMINMPLMKVGKWTEWYESGKIKLESYFHESKPNFKIGTWKYWNENGKLMKEENYKDDTLIQIKEY